MLNLAIVGAGGWGRKLVEAVQYVSPHVRFTHAVVNRTAPARAFCEAHGLAMTQDYASVLGNPAVDGIVSCGPAHLHAAHSLAALQAGKPVLAIKPMAMQPGDAHALKNAAAKSGVLLALGYNRCFFPNVAEMRRRLRAGAIGELLHSEGNFCVDRYGAMENDHWKSDPVNTPAGSLADHMLYLTIETMGRIAEVQAKAQRDISPNQLADVSACLLTTVNGRTALLTAIGVTPDFYRFQVFGSRGWMEIRGARSFTFMPAQGEMETLMFDAIDAERAEVEAFAAAIEGRAPFPVSPDDAVHGVEVLAAMGRSAMDGSAMRP